MANIPRAIGIIMDGNRRWAKGRGLPSLEGHRAGLTKVRDVVSWAHQAGVEEVTLYAFSTENWNRAPEEVAYLMELFELGFKEYFDELVKEGGRIRFIGERDRLPKKLQALMDDAEERSKNGKKGTLVIALSYGGRAEILAGVNRLLAEGKASATEEEFSDALWSAGLHDPDLIIRTGGDQRLSNFLTWQSAYSELHFTDTKWPDLGKEELDKILADFGTRERRHGK